MCVLLPSAKADITLPKAERDLLIFLASSKTVPSAPVLETYITNIDFIETVLKIESNRWKVI